MAITGIAATQIRLRNIADKVAENGRKVMNKGSDKIVSEAKINCPEDHGDLVSTIRAEKGREARDGGGHGGRLTITLTFGGVSPESGRDTDPYAVQIHENYEGMLKHGPGEKTLEKMSQYPDHQIGSHFLTRAADAERDRLRKAMIEAVHVGIDERDYEGDDA